MIIRRHLLAIAAMASAVALTTGSAGSQTSFPEQPIQVVAGFSAGGATDLTARVIVGKMSEILGQQVYVENKPGASTNLAAEFVARSAPDGYTLFIAGNSNSVNPFLRDDVPIDILEDFRPIARWASVPSVLVVPPSLEVSTLEELIEVAKERGGLSFASSGIGSVSHLSGEYLASLTGAELQHIPYQGTADAMNDLIRGDTQMMFAAAATVLPHVEAGRLTPIAWSTSRRPDDALPDLPTVAEAGLEGYEAHIWFGLVAPAGTPDEVVETLRSAVNEALESPEVQEQLRGMGIVPFPGDGEEYWAYMQSEMEKWSKIIEEAGIKAQ